MDTYANLQAAIADWLIRDDLLSVVPSFITLAEADINRSVRDFRMEKRSIAAVDTQYSALPTDWLETIRAQITGTSSRLELMPHAQMADMRASRADATGKPTHYAHTAGGLELYPTPDQEYQVELTYFARVPALSDTNTTNWLLAAAPDVYLYGALVQSAPYLKDDARTTIWAGLYQSAVTNLNAASQAARYSGAGLRMQFKG